MAINVTNEADLQACYLDATADYTVTQNITLTGAFTAYCIGNYTGNFNGGGYTITNLTIVANTNIFGFIKELAEGATLTNLNFTNVAISIATTETSVGGACGRVRGTVSYVNVLSGTITGRGSSGGITGDMLGIADINNCSFDGTLTSSLTDNGGICGYMYGGTISYCDVSGAVTGSQYCGGIVGACYDGSANKSISYCNFSGTLTITIARGGGIVGSTGASKFPIISYCTCTGTIHGSTYIGGILGHIYATISDCEVECDLSDAAGAVGGIAGGIATGSSITDCVVKNTEVGKISGTVGGNGGLVGSCYSATITNCTVTNCTIAGYTQVGGCFGLAQGSTITNCHSDATLTFSRDYIGGFVGKSNNANITKCSATGTFNPQTLYVAVGGFTGSCEGTSVISDCFSTMGALTYSTRLGGFVGYLLAGTIKKCYTTCATITGNGTLGCGGFVGQITAGTIDDCFSVGTVAGTDTNKGMFCGRKTGGTITNCGCKDDATIRDIGSPAGDVTYAKADPTEWYDKTENVYDTGANVWDFATPVWYEWSDRYPLFTEEPSLATDNAIFFGSHF